LESGTRWDFSGDKPHADRIEARMLEASLCSVPVYEKAGVLAMRSMGVPGQEQTIVVPTPRLLEARAWLVSLRR
jgi:phage head maturation protease